jgi:diacylglycerol kinase (ATP)
MTTIAFYNPRSGSVEQAREELVAHANRHAWELHEIGTVANVTAALRRAIDQPDVRLVVIGGDGTVSRIVHELHTELRRAGHVGPAPTLAVVPAGTGNDLARSIGVPRTVQDALALLSDPAEHQVQALDLLEIEAPFSRFAVNAINIGFARSVESALTDELKATWGLFAFLRAALEVLPELTPFLAEFELDQGAPRRLQAFAVLIANGRRVAGGLEVAPRARLDDGRFDLVVMRDTNLANLITTAARARLGALGADDVHQDAGQRFAMVLPPGIGMTVDGDGMDLPEEPAQRRLVVRCLPAAQRFIVGPHPQAVSESPD